MLFTLVCFLTFSITVLCSVHPEILGKNSFRIEGSISLFLVKYVVVLLASMRWKVFMILLDSAIVQKLPGSFVVPFLCMSFMILSLHWVGIALVEKPY